VRETDVVAVDLVADGDLTGWSTPNGNPVHAVPGGSMPVPVQLISPPLDFAAASFRYVYATIEVATADGAYHARLSWDAGDGFHDEASATWVVAPGRTARSYVIDLSKCGWPLAESIGRLRFDLLGTAGSARLLQLAILADLAQFEPSPDLRPVLAQRYLHGYGIECGALQNPMAVPPTARVVYIDRLTLAACREHYPELGGQALTPPHLVADLQRLPIADGRVDFAIGNHLLEHARDPIGGLCEFLRTLRPGGVAFVSVPDVANPMDRGRAVTSFEHLLADHEAEADRSAEDDRHYDESVAAAHPELSGDPLRALTDHFRRQAYSIHFHTFDEVSFRRFVGHAAHVAGATVEEYARNRTPEFDEYIVVLRRRLGTERVTTNSSVLSPAPIG
jgi:SAM-dependent methyltransferase